VTSKSGSSSATRGLCSLARAGRARGGLGGGSNSGPASEGLPGHGRAACLTCGSSEPVLPLVSVVALPHLPASRVSSVYRWLRVPSGRDAFGAPVLRDQGPIGRPGTARPIQASTPCMQCSFGLVPHPRSEPGAQPIELHELTVAVRWIPLVSAAYGTRVAWPARSMMARTWR